MNRTLDLRIRHVVHAMAIRRRLAGLGPCAGSAVVLLDSDGGGPGLLAPATMESRMLSCSDCFCGSIAENQDAPAMSAGRMAILT